MENENQATPASEENVQVEETQVEETTTEETTDTVESLTEKLAKAEEYGKNQKIRAEKAEKAPKAEPVDTAKKTELSQGDILAIARSDIHEEDIERVMKFAAMEDISVKDALANEDMKAILDRRAESRKVAAAANTDTSRASGGAVTGEGLVEQAKSGKLPDVKDLHSMFAAQDKR